ncbi:Cadherin-22 [Merluccius polli]|uniref:Cadherin-22 n=1 Tax=Merluccius polli TaxID=89951 RepID=A0AA47MRB6_MERPO|nr:Cadherin-22 [Merluccius polli]
MDLTPGECRERRVPGKCHRVEAAQVHCPPARPNNTAGIRTQRSGFNRNEQNVYFLSILVVDSGPPSLSSTGTVTIHVCGCDPDGAIQSCNATAYVMSAALSPGALIALLVCMLILIEYFSILPPQPRELNSVLPPNLLAAARSAEAKG